MHLHAPDFSFWVIIGVIFVVIFLFRLPAKEWRGLLIGGGPIVLAFCLLYWPANTLTLLALTAVMGGFAYGLAKVLHH